MPAGAQTAASRAKQRSAASPEAKRLDAKMEQVAELFLRDTAALITSYENIGQFERARVLLEAVQKLDPDNEQVKSKLAQIGEKILVGSSHEKPAEGDGTLYVKANLPPGSRATGRLKARISGPSSGTPK